MIKFILNNEVISTERSEGYRVLDFIRHDLRLTGTKESCREGDCGACLVLLGGLKNGRIVYKSVTSCLMLLGEIRGRHILTIEGINRNELNPFQQYTVNQNASQCGYCTPGFMVSITGYLLTCREFSYQGLVQALDGNICRCTGYASIKRVAHDLVNFIGERKEELLQSENRVELLADWNFLPEYTRTIKSKLEKLNSEEIKPEFQLKKKIIAGGTDLVVQKDEEVEQYDLCFLNRNNFNDIIKEEKGFIYLGSSVTVTDIYDSAILEKYLPEIKKKFHLVSSTPIRNMSTLAGNLVNASPIGDLTIFFLVLNSELVISKNGEEKILPLKNFYIDYKKIDLDEDEFIQWVRFPVPEEKLKINFEKISRRECLDIASVNSALSLVIENNHISKIEIAAGGVAPVPKFLEQTGIFALGKELNEYTVKEIARYCSGEISPISDARGSADYKRTLLRNLIYAHFLELCPQLHAEEII